MEEKKINPDFEKKKKERCLINNIILDNYNVILERIQYELSPLIYENNQLLRICEFNDYIKKEIQSLIGFLKTNETNICINSGKQASARGFNKRIIISLCRVLKNFFRDYILPENNTGENLSALFLAYTMIDEYKDVYLDSYYRQFIDQKNKEQGGLYNSLLKTISKQREEMLKKEQEQNRQRTAFLINLAHEIKLPLTIIHNQITMVIEEAGNRQLKTIPLLEEQITGLQFIIGNILDYEKILQGKMLYNHNAIVNISKAAATKAELFKIITNKKAISIESEIDQELYIRIAPIALDRILNNILDNAIKYNRDKGTIHIKVKADDLSVFFIVEDTGIGIPSDQLQHIFKPYYQIAHTKRSNRQGIGAGLSLVKSILKEVDGNIVVKSILHKGTTVTITFKREIITEDNKDKIVEDIKISRPLFHMDATLKPEIYDEKKKTILIVEDDMELLSYLQNNMVNDFNFYYAANGKDALKKLEFMPKPDIVVSDIIMDIMGGFEFLTSLREKKEMEDIPFIFLSAKATEEDTLKGLKHGAVAYIEKPFSIQILKEKIKSLIRDHIVYSEKATERMEKRIIKTIKTKESGQINYDLLYTKFNLSKREREIVQYTIKGLDNKDIAKKLFISMDTVKAHIQNIKKKCNVKNKVQLLNLFRK